MRSEAARIFYTAQASALRKEHLDWKATAMDHGVQSYGSQRYLPRVRDCIQLLGASGRAAD